MNEEIRVLIADDHPIFRRGLRAVIDSDPYLKIVGEAENGRVALAEIERLEPHVAVLDSDMPEADGLTVARTIQQKNLPTLPVFLTMHKDEAIFNAAIDADVKGFVIKDSAATDIVICIKEVAKGKRFFSYILSEFLLNRRERQGSPLESLTVSERRVLRLLANGKTSKEIAEALFISPRTVDHHRANISGKLDLKGKNGLLTFALNNKSQI